MVNFCGQVRNLSLYHALVTNQDNSKCQVCHSPVFLCYFLMRSEITVSAILTAV